MTSSAPSTCGRGVANRTSRSRAASTALRRPGGRARRAPSPARPSAAREASAPRHQTTRKTLSRPASAGGPQAARNPQKSSSPTSPIRMFCGLPMMVAAEPALAPPASAITNGRGSSPRRGRPAQSIGVIANTTTSLASTAESTPAGGDGQPSSAAGDAARSRSAPSTSRRSRRPRTGPRGSSARTGRSGSGSRSPRAPARRRPRRRRRARSRRASAMPVRSTLSPGQRPSAMPR